MVMTRTWDEPVHPGFRGAFWIFGGMFLLVAGGCGAAVVLMVAASARLANQQAETHPVRASGVITSNDGDGYPCLRYTVHGQPVTSCPSVDVDADLPVGQRVQVIYNRDDPGAVGVVGALDTPWADLLVLIPFGLVPMVIGTWALLVGLDRHAGQRNPAGRTWVMLATLGGLTTWLGFLPGRLSSTSSSPPAG
jgi:Protein of unknown function (DUF3592)